MMRRIFALVLMLCLSLSLFSQTASEILASNSVLAYQLDTNTYLMDVNTGKEISLPNGDQTTKLLWNSDGSRLFRFLYSQAGGGSKNRALISEILLPSLKEKVLLDTTFVDYDLIKMDLVLGVDKRIYLIELVEEYDDWYYDYYDEWFVSCYIDLDTNKRHELKFGELSAESYYPPKHKKILSEGNGIQNQFLSSSEPKHNELFITDDPKASNPTFRQLTQYADQIKTGKLTEDMIFFMVSPNDKLIVYNYYYTEPTNQFMPLGYTQVISRDGKQSLLISDKVALKEMTYLTFTDDSRLLFGKSDSKEREKKSICIMSQDFKLKTLKSFTHAKNPVFYYRYR